MVIAPTCTLVPLPWIAGTRQCKAGLTYQKHIHELLSQAESLRVMIVEFASHCAVALHVHQHNAQSYLVDNEFTLLMAIHSLSVSRAPPHLDDLRLCPGMEVKG